MNGKIDFVIMWVDPSDTAWQNERKKYAPALNEVDNREIRYRDWETLKYWFRAVEKFAPFVNRVHFVTCGHLPEFLNTQNPKLNVVCHKDFIDEEYLPTFSANPIELNLHRIQGLSQNFVFFNDDMFLTKPVKDTDFFKNNVACDCAVLSPVITYSRDGFAKLQINDMAVVNDRFDKNTVIKQNIGKWLNFRYGKELLRTLMLMPWKHFAGFLDNHIAISYNKKTFEKVWQCEEKILRETCKNKFRNNNTDVNNWLMRYFQLAEGNFSPRSVRFGRLFEYGKDGDSIYSAITKQKYSIVCLNDGENGFDFETEKQKTLEAFQSILPEKSSFER